MSSSSYLCLFILGPAILSRSLFALFSSSEYVWDYLLLVCLVDSMSFLSLLICGCQYFSCGDTIIIVCMHIIHNYLIIILCSQYLIFFFKYLAGRLRICIAVLNSFVTKFDTVCRFHNPTSRCSELYLEFFFLKCVSIPFYK